LIDCFVVVRVISWLFFFSDVNMTPDYPKLILAVLLSLYFLWIACDPLQGSFLDNVDLPIHEPATCSSDPSASL
jgi:hypothetical protein